MDSGLSAMDRWHAVKRLNTDAATSAIPVLTLGSGASSPAGLQRILAKIEKTLGEHLAAVQASEATVPGDDATTAKAPIPRVKKPPAPAAAKPALRVDVRQTRPRAAADEGRILVVDDNALNRDMLSRRLKRRGYDVSVAEEGQQALDAIRDTRFDLVLLDWMMPGLSGIEVLKRIRSEHSAVELPVIMATAKTEADDIVEALRLDANDYVTKPLNFDVVNARIKTQLGLIRAHRQLALSEQRYRALLENTGDMILQYRLDGELLYVSPASRALLGYEPEELKKHPIFHWLHPIDRRELESQQRQRPTLPPAFTFIARMMRRDQSFTWVEISCRVTRGTDGHAVVMAACRDVSEHMERIQGDEPPLPLGGDIMTHPGWRGGPMVERPEPAPAPAAETPAQVVLLTLVDGVKAEVLQSAEAGDHEEVVRQLGERLLATLKGRDA